MNDTMSLEQLEQLAKNPNYKLSEAQIKRMEVLRTEKFVARKHDYTVQKHDVVVHPPEADDAPTN